MFEAHVLHILRRYLGDYVRGLSAEALKISVWQGDVVLKDLQLKAEALNSLKLPITVKAGFLGSVTLKVPWNRLGKESVVVILDRIFILAEPIQDERSCEGDDKKQLLEVKRRQLKEAESAILEPKDKKPADSENVAETSSWLGSLIATIVGNLKISITNVHIRYEDNISNPGRPFCSGATLSRLAAVTIDDGGKETFVSSGALDKLHKSLHLERFAIYHDSNTSPWKSTKNWEAMTPKEWGEVFEAGINEEPVHDVPSTKDLGEHQYLLRPVDGNLHYHRGGKQEKRDPGVAFQNVSVVLNELSLTVSEAQYCDGLKLLEGVSQYRTRIEFSHFRPRVPVLENPHVWWIYACQAGLRQQKKTWFHLSGERVVHLCCLRRKYVQLYADLLQQKIKSDSEEIQTIEEELDMEVLLLWRLLAHAKVRGLKSKESIPEKEQTRTGRWWAFGWGTAGVASSGSTTEPVTQKQEAQPGHFTAEEWSKLNELLSYQPGEDMSLLSASEAPDMLQISVSATITESAVRILDKKNAEILRGNFTCLSVGLQLYPKTLECRVKLQSYGLSAPEGSLIKSVSREGKEEALTGYFVHCPLDGNVDWRLSATVSPCYVTFWFASFERFMQFLKSSHAVSPDVASETAMVLQNKLEQVRRRAQEQLKIALEEQGRFSIELDLDAPKVRLPADSKVTDGMGTQLLLDLGHFTLHTAYEDQWEEQGHEQAVRGSLYSQFYISGSDMAAYLVDGSFEWSEMQHLLQVQAGYDQQDEAGSIYAESPVLFPVLDRCGMFLLFEKIRIPHPIYPSHHIAIQVPHLGLHFSPARYQRLMDLLATFKSRSGPKDGSEVQESATVNVSWYPADHEGNVRVLFWKGLGNAVAEWQPCWAVLSGSYLYILDSSNAQTYQRCCSMSGKQVLDVPSSNIGGSEFVLAVCNRGVELQKGLESSNTVIMQFVDEECKASWLKSLTLAVYKSSAPVSLSLPEELMGNAEDIPIRQEYLGQPVLFLTGSLHALQLSIYTVGEFDVSRSDRESLIVILQAGGGKINMLQQQYDLIIGMKLNYLKIEDKLQGSLAPSCHYIARSVLSKVISQEDDGSLHMVSKLDSKHREEEDCYRDASSDFGGSQDQSLSHESSSKSLHSDSMQTLGEFISCKERDFSAQGLDPLKLPKGTCLIDKIFEEPEGESRNFVSMHFISRQFESPDYNGIDVEMSICMATLEFFCNRQTVVALITFGTEISEIVEKPQSSEALIDSETNAVSSDYLEPSADRVIVKGLLGEGKSRIVFQLKMKVDSVRIFLNKEDGSQLAMLSQERFHVDFKVHPGSFLVSGTLGNLRVCDMALGLDHCWGWICDIRDPGCDSLVKLEFQSFNVDEDDYKGYDYSLCGKLSSVRIVFLYRFLQEVLAYFSALATPHAQQFTRVVDKVGGMEKLVPQSDIDGAPALKLDVSLETPIIVMPRCSTSKEFMQLDLGYLKLSNTFEWHGGLKDDASAIRLDVLSAEISGINLIVGIDGVEGKAMIQELRGLHVTVRRPLRDLFRSVPDFQVDLKVEKLKGIISDKEYIVISGCAATNIAEAPHLPSDFRKSAFTSSGSIGASTDIPKVPEMKSLSSGKSSSLRQAVSSWTVARVAIEVQNAELELFNGLERESALARVELQDFWLSYRSTSNEEMDIFVTLPRLSVLDLRSETKPEMRLMLGSMADTETTVGSDGQGQSNSEKHSSLNASLLSMLVMDVRMKKESQAYVIRIQRPRVLVVIDFLLAVGEFFVPSLLAVTGKDESMDLNSDPIVAREHIRLTKSLHMQDDAVVVLSRDCQLIVDAPDIKEFTYDGGGNILCLDNADIEPYQLMMQPLVVVGPGKRLRFKNIRIKNGVRLKDCLQLHLYSSYSCLEEDGVVLEGPSTETNMELQTQFTEENSGLSRDASMGLRTSSDMSDIVTNFVLDVQAVAPELVFYDSEKWSLAIIQGREKLLRAKMDINLMYACKDYDKWIRGHVKGFSIEGGSGVSVIDPMVISAEYACVKEKTSLTVFTSDIAIHLSFSVMRLLLRLYNDTMSTFQFGGGHILSRCSHFDRIWLTETGHQRLAIWRPRAPSGYAILGDCITSGEAPPSQAVMAVGKSYRRVKKPSSFELIWSLSGWLSGELGESDGIRDDSNDCSIWRPVAPPGYVALGCVANMGKKPPSLSVVYCVRSDLVTSASINDCIFYVPTGSGARNGFSIWRIENAAGSFLAHQSTESPAIVGVYDLREVLHQGESSSGNSENIVSSRSHSPGGGHHQLDRKTSISTHESTGVPPKAGRYIATTANFERMWWGKGNDLHHVIAIWRPVPPSGYAIVGDYITEGLEPPSVSIVLRDDDSGRLAAPIGFAQRMHSFGKGMEDLFVWYPVAPAGYVTLGCVVSRTEETNTLNTVRCVRVDLVSEVNISKRPIWSVSGSKSGPYSCSLWKVENQANTFLARPDLKRPSSRLGYGLLETVKSRLKDTLSAEMKIRRLSVTLFDDLRGLMTPLVDVSVTSINVAGNGQREDLSAVCVASMAASTFNPQLEAWEPLIEPFEGIFKYESHDLQSDATLKVGKRIRITTANILNLNVTSANIDCLINGALSWQKQSDYEQKAFSKMELERDGMVEPSASLISSALEEDDSEKLVVQNKLGSVLFLRTFDHAFEDCTVLECDKSMQIGLPPPNFPDRTDGPTGLKLPCHHVAICISEARDLPVNDDGNGQEFFYSLRVAFLKGFPEGKESPIQSARSRCVRPSVFMQRESTTILTATAAWNEVFIFDLPQQGSVSVDIRVSNQAAKAGRGELIGTLSIPLEADCGQGFNQASSHWKLVQKYVNQAYQSSWPTIQGKTYALEHPKKQATKSSAKGNGNGNGSIIVNMCFFAEKSNWNAEKDTKKHEHSFSDTGLFIGLNPKEHWLSIRSILATGTFPIQIADNYIGLEVAMKQGQKHAIFRSLVTVFNDTDVFLEVCVCPMSLLNSPDGPIQQASNEPVAVIEELFENQRYQPLAGGWGSKWPGHLLPNDPGRWSTRNYEKSSQIEGELEAALPPGWIWNTDWIIDKAGYVDDDGWAYGPDFQSLKWPLNSLKSCKKSTFDFVRRRRWVRTRQRNAVSNQDHCRQVITIMQPGGSIHVPLAYTLPQTDHCLQVRPHTESMTAEFLWSRSVSAAKQHNRGHAKNGDDQSSSRNLSQWNKNGISTSFFMLNRLEKTEELVICPAARPSVSKLHWWLNVETDASILYTEMNSPIYDWRLSVRAPLKLENLLPCAAEYSIWEKQREANPVQRGRGVVLAGASLHIFSVDVRNQVYLTWLVQGGWKLEKEIVLISDPSPEELPSGFGLVHQQSGRRLQISLEHDFGGTNTAARTVRLFVPYWLCNKAGIPLSYRLVEVEPGKGSNTDTPWLMRAVKAAKQASDRPSHTLQRKTSQLRRVVQHLGAIESIGVTPIMLSPQARYNRTGLMPFSPRADDGLLTYRLGISIAASHSSVFQDGISFRDLEDNERVNVNALAANGAYYKLSVFLSMSSERTKVVNFQPHTLFVNRLGQSLCLRQCDLDCAELLYPNDPPKAFLWQSLQEHELLKVCVNGYKWSTAFSVDCVGMSHILLRSEHNSKPLLIRAEIRNGATESRFLVIFRHVSFASPYRIENRSVALAITFRQVGGNSESWQLVQPASAVPFAWEDLKRERQLEIRVDGADPLKSRKYNIDECTDSQPQETGGSPVAALHVTTFKEGPTQVVKICDWMPSNRDLSIVPYGTSGKAALQEQFLVHDTKETPQQNDMENQLHILVELAEFGLSVVDHTPEELLYLSMQNFSLVYATGLGSGTSRFKVRVDGLQLDNQLSLTPMPVLIRPQVSEGPLDFLLKCTVTSRDHGSADRYVYPYIGIQGPSTPNTAFLTSIHEPIIWRLYEMFQRLNLGRLTASQTTDVAVDPVIHIGLLNTSEIRFKVSLAMSPTQRPRGALGFWASLMTALGNTDDMQVRIAPHVHEDISMRESALTAAFLSSVRKDLLSHPLLLLSGVDILGNASSALGHMSKGVAALSMDKKFIKGRQKQDSKAAVEGFGDGVREGVGALGKGLFRGVTGILTKPFEGAKSSGMEGFVQGVGKGIIGVAAQPVSGVLDLLSKTTEGANVMRMKIVAAITSEAALLRRRLPRVIGGDNILRPYDEYKAQGQTLLQLAERSSIFGPMDIFKIRGKFAMSDAYEDHYNLPKGRTLLVTHRRVLLLQHPTSIIVQKKPDLLKDPCTVLWDVTWKDIAKIELMHGKHDSQNAKPSRLALHLQSGSQDARLFDSKDLIRIIKCHPDSDQAAQIQSSIKQAMATYGTDQSRSGAVQRKRPKIVKRPYSGPVVDAASMGFFQGPATPASMPPTATFSSLEDNTIES